MKITSQGISHELRNHRTIIRVLKHEESRWPSSADSGQGIASGTFYGNLRRYFKITGLAGKPVSRSLDHNSHAVTSLYLMRLEGTWDRSAQPLSLSFFFNAARTFSAVMGRSRIRTPTAS